MTDALPRHLLIGVGCHLICQSGKLPQVRTWKSRLRVNVCESVTERESCWSSWYTVLLTNLLHHMTMSQTSYPSAASLNNNITRSSSAPVKMNQFKYWKHCFCFYLPSCPLPSSPLCPDVEQMAIDWLTGNFYFVDDVDDRIFVCDKDGQTCVTLLDQELYNPKGIALDPTMGSVLSLTFCLIHKHTHTQMQTQVSYACSFSKCTHAEILL